MISKIIGLLLFIAAVYRYREEQDLLSYVVQLLTGSKVARRENYFKDKHTGG